MVNSHTKRKSKKRIKGSIVQRILVSLITSGRDLLIAMVGAVVAIGYQVVIESRGATWSLIFLLVVLVMLLLILTVFHVSELDAGNRQF